MTGAFRLYTRPGCHLCEQARTVAAAAGLAVEEVDIEGDARLGARYGLRIPVLARPDGAELDWPFDADSLRCWLDRA